MKRNNWQLKIIFALGALVVGLMSVAYESSRASGQDKPTAPNGAALFEGRCLLCHGTGSRASQLSALSKLTAEAIYTSITTGSMQPMATGLSDAERRAIADYIVGQGAQHRTQPTVSPCRERAPSKRSHLAQGFWNGWSPDQRNTRFQTAAATGLTAAEVPSLQLKWAFVFPDAATAALQATVVNGYLYFGSWDGTIYALDAQTGCSYWTFKADFGVRTAVSVANGLAMFGDFQANVYAVDAETGKLRWRTKVEDHPAARITGSPLAYQGRLYVPVASVEEGLAGEPTYACCTFRGSVVALDLTTGKQLWKAYTIDEVPKQIGVNKKGTARIGPSGVAIWSAPTLDAQRGLLYVSTGNSYTEPDVAATDAVMAIDLQTGAKRWVRSLRPSDRWNASCLSPDKINCPPDEGPDFDFGSSPVLVRLGDGRELILAGQKSGVLYALDPDKQGAVQWEMRLGQGGTYGGILWGMATDSKYAYVAVSDWNLGVMTAEGALTVNYTADGALNAVDLNTGKRLWRTPNPPDTCRGRDPACSMANGAAVTAIPGVAFVGSLDGHLRAYDTRDGKIIWDYDTSGEVVGINNIKGHGGSINAAGVTVANGMLYQTSGYAAYAMGMGGNVLLAFEVPKEKRLSTVKLRQQMKR